MQDTDPNNLLIISKSLDDHDQTLKDAIINDPLLPLHTNLPLLSNQNENLLKLDNNLQLDSILNKQTEFTYDTFKQFGLEQQCLLPQMQSTLEENLTNLNLMKTSTVHSTLNRQTTNLNSPACIKSYYSKSNLDNGRIIYSTINALNAGNQLALNNSINLTNNSIQLNDNQSTELLTNSNESDLIEMSVNGGQSIYAMNIVSEKNYFELSNDKVLKKF